MSANELRLVLLAAGVLFLFLLYWFGRRERSAKAKRGVASRRSEPRGPQSPLKDDAEQSTKANGDASGGMQDDQDAAGSRPRVVLRALRDFERVVVLYVVADEEGFALADVVVACEKLGLVYGEGGIFHRLPEGDREGAPLFSVASMVEPGRLELERIDSVRLPGLCVFMAIPGPRPALDQWEAMLPAAERLAGLLGGRLLDERMNALGRQGIAHLRDELRKFDRRQMRRWTPSFRRGP